MTVIDHEKVAARVQARKQALACIDLLDETVNAIRGDDARDAFWDTIHARIEEVLPPLTTAQEAIRDGMTASEVLRFEQEACPLKKYSGELTSEVPLGYLDYIVGQQTDPESYVNRAARYLKNPQVAERLREELSREDWRLDQ